MDAQKIANKIKRKYKITNVEMAIVSGSGLLSAVPEMADVLVVKYGDVGMPKSKVKGHESSFIFGKINGKSVVILSRKHYYENADIKEVRLPIEVAGFLGVKEVILMSSCGGINEGYSVGDVMLIRDHINMSGVNPLLAMEKIDFIDMLNCYDDKNCGRILKIADNLGIALKQGVFGQMSGPSYETMAEAKMLRNIGVDAVSMSTAHDCIVARSLNIKVLGFAVIVNTYNSLVESVSHEEVLENAKKAANKLKQILSEYIG